MRRLADSLWTAEAPLRFLGIQVGRRMTVIRLADGGLLVHSPCPLTDELHAELATLGPVRYVVAASLLHGHVSMGDYAAAYPGAELIAPPGLAVRRRDLTFAGELAGGPDPRWGDDVDALPLAGHRHLTEILFLHRPSRTLIAGDACWNAASGLGLAARLWAGGRRRIGPTPAFRLSIKDRAAARQSLDRILAWDFDRLVPGHGDVVETGGRDALARAYLWLVG